MIRSLVQGVLVGVLGLACASVQAQDTPTGGDPGLPPLVVISFDGFRWDYAAGAETPALDSLAEHGARAERLVPVFPSKTFPAHYSIATGLYPGHHGIVSNNMRDPAWPEIFGLGNRAEVQNGRWWGGEPIWTTAARQGLRSAVYFWPGSEAPIGGAQPDLWFSYDESVGYETRVEEALAWLTAAEDRPDLVMLYFDEPNTTGHGFGPDAPETRSAVERVDGVLGLLLAGLERHDVEANVVVVSDHGMAQNHADRLIFLEDYVDLADDELFEFGAMAQIFPLPGREPVILEALSGAHPHLRVWTRDSVPERLHTAGNPRLAPIVASPDAGWEVLRSRTIRHPIPGDHGQDPQHPDMHGIFYAAGPSVVSGITIPAIEQVDVYPLMAALLGIEPAPHDGDTARVAGLLR